MLIDVKNLKKIYQLGDIEVPALTGYRSVRLKKMSIWPLWDLRDRENQR